MRRIVRDSYTYIEAARRLGITKKTLWEWRKRYETEDWELGYNYTVFGISMADR